MEKETERRGGFTLIELIVVVTILALLLSIAIINILGSLKKTRDRQRKSDIRQIRAALEMYRSTQRIYPASLYSNPCPTPSVLSDGITVYMLQIPHDPLTKDCYVYTLGASSYTLYACLENRSDPERDAAAQAGCANASFTIVGQ